MIWDQLIAALWIAAFWAAIVCVWITAISLATGAGIGLYLLARFIYTKVRDWITDRKMRQGMRSARRLGYLHEDTQ